MDEFRNFYHQLIFSPEDFLGERRLDKEIESLLEAIRRKFILKAGKEEMLL